MKKPLLAAFASAFIFLSILGKGYGAPFTYELGENSLIDTSGTVNALKLEASLFDNFGGDQFTLADGESYAFDFARVWTEESWLNTEDDFTPGSVEAIIDFDMPDLDTQINGTSVGFIGSWGWIPTQGWRLEWNDPVEVFFGNGGKFQVELEDASFSAFYFAGPDGWGCKPGSDTIKATITQISSPSTNVPEPDLLMMLGMGLVAVSGWKRVAGQ